MFLKCHTRVKDGKTHRYFSIVEKRRVARGTVDRHVLYLGEINSSQQAAWIKQIEAFDEQADVPRRLALFPDDVPLPAHAVDAIQVRLSQFQLKHPRQWGACFAFTQLWHELRLDEFWSARLATSREGTNWHAVLQVLVAYRLIDPGSEWRLHRQWFAQSAMGDLLNGDDSLAEKDTLYRCMDKLLTHKDELHQFLKQRWQDLFGATFDVLLYDLTSTYFESSPPFAEGDKRRYGYSRDHRPDCVQVVISLICTPEGLPLTYEVLAGNTADSRTLPDFLARIEKLYGKARRIWVMDRGIPTDDHLKKMREQGAQYLVGTPKGRLSKLENDLATRSWQTAREEVRVKLLLQDKDKDQDPELYVYVHSRARVDKERAMRKQRLKRYLARLKQLKNQRPRHDTLLIKLGAAKHQAGRAAQLVTLTLPSSQNNERIEFDYTLNRTALRKVRSREGRYLLRSNLTDTDPAKLWEFYLQLTQIEAAFKTIKSDLSVRPIYHQRMDRIEAHIFIAFLAYCLQVTLTMKLKPHAPGLTARSALETLAGMQLLDVHFPTTDGRELIFQRYTQPEPAHQLLLDQLHWKLPPQAPPKITQQQLKTHMN